MKNSNDTIWNRTSDLPTCSTVPQPTALQRDLIIKVNVKQSITGVEWPRGFQEVKVPRFQDNRQMKLVRLSALSTGHLYPPGNIPGTHFC